jgi:hypothetical protein
MRLQPGKELFPPAFADAVAVSEDAVRKRAQNTHVRKTCRAVAAVGHSRCAS